MCKFVMFSQMRERERELTGRRDAALEALEQSINVVHALS